MPNPCDPICCFHRAPAGQRETPPSLPRLRAFDSRSPGSANVLTSANCDLGSMALTLDASTRLCLPGSRYAVALTCQSRRHPAIVGCTSAGFRCQTVVRFTACVPPCLSRCCCCLEPPPRLVHQQHYPNGLPHSFCSGCTPSPRLRSYRVPGLRVGVLV